MAYRIFQMYKMLKQKEETRAIMETNSISSVAVLKRFSTSRKEKNPALRAKIMQRRGASIATTSALAEKIPEFYKGIRLKEPNKKDLETGFPLVTPSAPNWWALSGEEGDPKEVETVYRMYFERYERLKNAELGPVMFTKPIRRRELVQISPVPYPMKPETARSVIMEILFPEESGIPSPEVLEHISFIKEKREQLSKLNINKLSMAYMLERETIIQRKHIPIVGGSSAGEGELAHLRSGQNWISQMIPVPQTATEIREQTLMSACREIVVECRKKARPLQDLRDILKTTTVEGESMVKMIKTMTSGDSAVSICKASLGLPIDSVLRFKRMALRRIRGKGSRREDLGITSSGQQLKLIFWSGQEEFGVTCNTVFGRVTGTLKKDDRKITSLIIQEGEPGGVVELILHCHAFVGTEECLKSIRDNLRLTNRSGKPRKVQYAFIDYLLMDPNTSMSYFATRETKPVGNLLPCGTSGMPSKDGIPNVFISKVAVDSEPTKKTDNVTITEAMEVQTMDGSIIASPEDVEIGESANIQGSVVYESRTMWGRTSFQVLCVNTYKAIAKKLPIMFSDYNTIGDLAFTEGEELCGKLKKGIAPMYSYFCRELLGKLHKEGKLTPLFFLKLAPICWTQPRQVKGEFSSISFDNEYKLEVFANTGLVFKITGPPGQRQVKVFGVDIPLSRENYGEITTEDLIATILPQYLIIGKAVNPSHSKIYRLSEVSTIPPEGGNLMIGGGEVYRVRKRKRAGTSLHDTRMVRRRQMDITEALAEYE
uniref:PB2 n=1 Tax=Wuhan asiatic toad influenza virus TaxID=2116482 RepID=A0A2P1GNS9_9ORTO|nr:PB2 [Wuhan asiatic toad influenza virus]